MKQIFWCGCRKNTLFTRNLLQKSRVFSVQRYCEQAEKDPSAKHHHHHHELKQPSNIWKYTIDKYIKFVGWYEVKLKRFPKAFHIYKLFKDGIAEFGSGAKTYASVSVDVWTGTPLDKFTRHQLEIYRQMPRDMLKVFPVLAISILPFANYVIFPIAYLVPRYLLSRQFWTPEQRIEFPLQDLKHRVDHYHKIFYAMRLNMKHIEHPLYKSKLEQVVDKLESKSHPKVEEILETKSLFEYGAYQLDELSVTYAGHLSRSMLMSMSRRKLWEQAFILHHIDKALAKEGIEKLTESELQQSCLARGLNPVGLSTDSMIAFLKTWTAVSSSLNEDNQSLLLHLPVLLTFHHPNNVKLYKKKRIAQMDRKMKASK
ncbi:LETM1 domain-containing protein 1-like [Lineus longissimus]|uniref:LETM1 domain-containing protein 1-like n=1 Tax=Lineus longissimus TaxID=88925 RepID=UPI00315C6311